MNAFLLKIAADNMRELAKLKGDPDYAEKMSSLSESVFCACRRHAWKGDFFARVLINRKNKFGLRYLGAQNDGFCTDPDIGGTYYLNSFSWSILSDVADEEQIAVMLNIVERHLKTPSGFKLCTAHSLSSVTSAAAGTEQYFPGDRENGGVFKHAAMMAVTAMLKASKTVSDSVLRGKLLENAYFMLGIVMPYKTLQDPHLYKGNPRFCTQYNNPITRENVGPILSGTSTWLVIALMEAYGIGFTPEGIVFSPALSGEQKEIRFDLALRNASYSVTIEKKRAAFCDGKRLSLYVDGVETKNTVVRYFNDNKRHGITLKYLKQDPNIINWAQDKI
jgi:cellobiose phosphorylase